MIIALGDHRKVRQARARTSTTPSRGSEVRCLLLVSPCPTPAPVAPAASVLAGDHWRITVLLDGLLRLEWSDDGGFEDRSSTFAVHRDLPVPAFEVQRSDDRLEIVTELLHLTWDLQLFSAAGLTVQVRGRVSNHRSTWRWGTTPQTLGGTGRTLDMADGAIPLEPGVVARDGIATVDDSTSFLFTDDGWIGSRVPGRVDVYVFAYGHDYRAAIRALYAVSGPQRTSTSCTIRSRRRGWTSGGSTGSRAASRR